MATASKDTTPSGNRTQRYRVDGRAFLNGTIVHPSGSTTSPRFEYGPPGQHGKALVAVDENGTPMNVPQRQPAAVNSDAKSMRRHLDAAFAEIEQLKAAIGSDNGKAEARIAAAEEAVHTLQARLDAERAESGARIAELEKKLANRQPSVPSK